MANPIEPARQDRELLLVSFLILFLELAMIRWLPAHVLYLTFFTNIVLLASFLGISLGCMAARRERDFLAWTAPLLVVIMAAGQALGQMWRFLQASVNVGNQAAPELIFFGAEAYQYDLAKVTIPIEVICGTFFVLVALSFVGLGQRLGRLFDGFPDRIRAYTLNIGGSLAGIGVFTACSWLRLPPFWWFAAIAAGLGYLSWPAAFGSPRPLMARCRQLALLAAIMGLAAISSWNYWSRSQLKLGKKVLGEHHWSPYYRINYLSAPHRAIVVNLIGHQGMISTQPGAPAANTPSYALPYLLRRDSGAAAFKDVLVIGAGSGNDVSRALQWGVEHVDAVEIDPVIQRLGRRDHPDRPYQDGRVAVHIDDGRHFMKVAGRKYDLIVYALVDSLVLHSSLSSIRLESYLFTKQAFMDARRLLKPGGLMVTYNTYRQDWVVNRIYRQLKETFGGEPIVMTLPYQPRISPRGGYTMLLAGDTGPLRAAFQRHGPYALRKDEPPGPQSSNGFLARPKAQDTALWNRYGPAAIDVPGDLLDATDDWPFLYLRRPMLPSISLRAMAVMGGLAILLLALFMPKRETGSLAGSSRMFFLGAGFMLMETKAVVHMALLFGSTWMVNTIVFFAILAVILAANLLVQRFKPVDLRPYYIAVFVSLLLNWALPIDFFLGFGRVWQIAGSSLMIGAPFLFAGIIFALSFERSRQPDWDFGLNVAGALFGGLMENASMLFGFQNLVLLALAFYALSTLRPDAVGRRRGF